MDGEEQPQPVVENNEAPVVAEEQQQEPAAAVEAEAEAVVADMEGMDGEAEVAAAAEPGMDGEVVAEGMDEGMEGGDMSGMEGMDGMDGDADAPVVDMEGEAVPEEDKEEEEVAHGDYKNDPSKLLSLLGFWAQNNHQVVIFQISNNGPFL